MSSFLRIMFRQNVDFLKMSPVSCLMLLIILAHLSWMLKWAFLITYCPSSVRLSVCLSVCKLFTFSSSSQEPLGQFQPNLAQSNFGWREFKFVQMKGHTLFQGKIIAKILKLYRKLQNHWVNFNQTWHKACLGLWWFKFVQMKGYTLLKVDIILK